MIGVTQSGRYWDPWRDFADLRDEMNKLLSGQERQSRSIRSGEFPSVDVWQGEHGLLLTCELPGVDPSALDVTVVKDAVTIQGQRKPEEFPEEIRLHREERSKAPFSRTIGLPYDVDPQQTEAAYSKGILKLTLQRPEEHKPQRVKIKAG